MSHMSHVLTCFHLSQVSGQALVDLLNHAKENGALGIESMGWDGNPKVGKGGKRWKKEEFRFIPWFLLVQFWLVFLYWGVILFFGGGDVRIWTFRYLGGFWIHHSWVVGPLYNVHKGPVTWPWKHSRQHHRLNEIIQWILLWIPCVFLVQDLHVLQFDQFVFFQGP